ncbi:hypothetical protein ACFYYD_11580 [Streptomyces bluensis]|uniref:hypothetical protein n=1 Tax=Streptomyces bluensis TaxID=33897 RepID=UPI003691E34D
MAEGKGFGNPDDALFVRGVDYVSAWRDADEAAQRLNDAVAGLGVDSRVVRAVPHAGAHGEPVVWMPPEGVRLIADLLDTARKLREAG